MLRGLIASSISRQVAVLSERFLDRFDIEPEFIAAAPGRVNLIGEHTDYNGGYVLPFAINRMCRIAAAGNSSNDFRIYSVERDEEVRFSLCDLDPEPRGDFGDYIRGVAGFCEEGHSISGFDAVVSSEVPLGSGLSSSAALEVATATLLEAIIGIELPPLEKALICQKAENSFVGVPCGLMDQYASVFGCEDQLILLDCEKNESEYVTFDDPAIELRVINSNVRHHLADSEYALRRLQCLSSATKFGTASLRSVTASDLEAQSGKLDADELKRARHVVSENERNKLTVVAVQRHDWTTAGEYLYWSHESLRDDFEVSCKELDVIVDICRSIGEDGGVFGARMTGPVSAVARSRWFARAMWPRSRIGSNGNTLNVWGSNRLSLPFDRVGVPVFSSRRSVRERTAAPNAGNQDSVALHSEHNEH